MKKEEKILVDLESKEMSDAVAKISSRAHALVSNLVSEVDKIVSDTKGIREGERALLIFLTLKGIVSFTDGLLDGMGLAVVFETSSAKAALNDVKLAAKNYAIESIKAKNQESED